LAEFPSKALEEVYVRYLARLVQDLDREGQGILAQSFYKRLLDALPAQAVKPAFEEVKKGWGQANE
jgi:hypothetical protein